MTTDTVVHVLSCPLRLGATDCWCAEQPTPIVNTVTGYKRGKCAVCGGSAERQASFPTVTAHNAWKAEPVKHKRCEQ